MNWIRTNRLLSAYMDGIVAMEVGSWEVVERGGGGGGGGGGKYLGTPEIFRHSLLPLVPYTQCCICFLKIKNL